MDSSGKRTQEISGRIDQIRQYFCNGINVDFAAKIGKDPTYTSQLCTGTKSIGNKIIEKILETFPEVSKTWLYLGEGEMLTSSNTNEQQNVRVGGDNIVNGSIKKNSSPEDAARYDRLISLLEKEHEERSRLLAIIENLTNK